MTSYAFEDYDAFLASFSENKANIHNNNNNNHNNSNSNTNTNTNTTNSLEPLSRVLSPEDNEVFDFYDFQGDNNNVTNNNNNNPLLSPDYTSNSSSPNELFQQDYSQGIPDYSFNDMNATNGLDSVNSNTSTAMNIKQESFSTTTSSASASPEAGLDLQRITTNSHRAKLSDALPHGAITKRGMKKEKSSHNMIEKRYRTNINDKIKALRDSVPALRVLVDSGDDDFDDLEGLQPAKKLNKATILSKATEYIKHLEAKNDSLRKENEILKSRLYGSSNITPGSSVSSYSNSDIQSRSFSNNSMNNNNNNNMNGNKLSLGNKVLLGGLACMVGSGLSDDLGNMDTKSLFALPVFGYDSTGVQVLTKPLILLLKFGFIFAVLLNFMIPSLFYSKPSKKQGVEYSKTSHQSDDIRNLTKMSIWSTFNLAGSTSNNDYVKSGIVRCLLLKIWSANSNVVVKSMVEFYIEHLWNYLKEVHLDPQGSEYENLKVILSLANDQTIHNDDYLLRLINQEVKLVTDEKLDIKNAEATEVEDFSIVSILYQMINETITNKSLRNFMMKSVNSKESISEIETSLIRDVDDYNVELKTLFNPSDEQIKNYKTILESCDVANVKNYQLLVLYASIIQNLIFIKKDFINAQKWFNKLEIQESSLHQLSLLGFTSLYIMILSMTSSKELYQDDKEVIFKIEEISANLRIWLGNSHGSILSFKKRSQLIDYFVEVGLKINGLEQNVNEELEIVAQ